jgi:hypothetical protein
VAVTSREGPRRASLPAACVRPLERHHPHFVAFSLRGIGRSSLGEFGLTLGAQQKMERC